MSILIHQVINCSFIIISDEKKSFQERNEDIVCCGDARPNKTVVDALDAANVFGYDFEASNGNHENMLK